ncbi:hypothetical protein L1987_54614 [Smallanthus sonchifolius]|uniref:Uncharacterized protein n=1 Tax=Smallanthus sonchifolius TaxID=185202 RepID=A0ACB9E749_9ASTR|nr:hypothetical protein L1987_54614 [Smallanthus sonchifolius]
MINYMNEGATSLALFSCHCLLWTLQAIGCNCTGVTPKMLKFMRDLRKAHELSCSALLRRIGEALDEQERISLTSGKQIGY